jgi:ribonuclease D
VQSLFVSLFKWRDDKSKNYDMSPNQFLPVEKLAFITRAKPSTLSNLKSLYYNVKNWCNDDISELFNLIKENESQVVNQPLPVQPIILRNFELPDYCSDVSDAESDFSVEHMEVEVQISPPPQEIQPSNANVVPRRNLQELTGKNSKNVMKKIRLWGNRFKRNKERVEKGLIPIRYYKNKGRKHKIRQAELRRTLYSDSFS